MKAKWYILHVVHYVYGMALDIEVNVEKWELLMDLYVCFMWIKPRFVITVEKEFYVHVF